MEQAMEQVSVEDFKKLLAFDLKQDYCADNGQRRRSTTDVMEGELLTGIRNGKKSLRIYAMDRGGYVLYRGNQFGDAEGAELLWAYTTQQIIPFFGLGADSESLYASMPEDSPLSRIDLKISYLCLGFLNALEAS